MKKWLLLPLALLASCAPTTTKSGEPLRTGEVLLVTGTTSTGQSFNQKYTIAAQPTRDDGDWIYTAKSGANSLNVIKIWVTPKEDYLELRDTNLGAKTQDGGMVMACFTYPNGHGWQEAKGYIVYETITGFSELRKQMDSKTDEAAWRDLLAKSGRCTITRQ